ncbi:MAG: sigma-54-dependent transcriptional regulator [bacterium]
MINTSILVAERDEILHQNLKKQLSSQGFNIIKAFDMTSAIQSLEFTLPDLVIIGSSLNNSCDGLKLTEYIRRQDRKIPIIFITSKSSEDRVIAAFRAGVTDYFKDPFSFNELTSSINRNLSALLEPSSSNKKKGIPNPDNTNHMIGDSKPIREIKEYLLKIALTDTNVLITGETGTGKELAAEMIHQNSLKRKRPLVCINCASFPDSLLESELFGYERGAFTGAVTLKQGKFELANGGTILLDEIGDMDHFAQAKILRAIERKEVFRIGGRMGIPLDVRVIAATNKNPEQMMIEGKFRNDLYYRLNVARVHMPPLRERKDDILALINYYIQKLNQRFNREAEGFTEEALAILLNYDWPGNIRELKNILEATFINLPSRKISFMELPKIFQKQIKEMGLYPGNEKDRLLYTLLDMKWNKRKSARKLRWSRMTLYRKMAKYNIIAPKPVNSKIKKHNVTLPAACDKTV